MRELEITSLYDSVPEDRIQSFTDKIQSNMRVKTDYYKEENNLEWLDIFEKILPYIEKIMRNPKRFITTEEEIVKIESAKRVGVETVKHLAKHTNYIQDLDDKTGDVIPSKLLNVLKEETFNTYENRFIYTLIVRSIEFVNKKLENIKKNPRLKDNKKIEYTSSTLVGQEQVNVSIQLDTALDTNLELDKRFYERVKSIQSTLSSLQYTEVYRALEKEGVAFVTPPIKKTNVILKNVNFQYAMTLWEYVHANIGKKDNPIKKNKDYIEKGAIKGLIDETFLLEYLTVNTINNDEELTKETKDRTLSRMLDKIIDLKTELTKKELQEKLGLEFDKAKLRRIATKNDIEKIFRKYIDKYLEMERK